MKAWLWDVAGVRAQEANMIVGFLCPDRHRRYTCVHFPNSYGSLNISDNGQTRRVICQTFWGKVVGLQWDLVQLAICCHHQRNASQLIRSRNTFFVSFLTLLSCIVHHKILIYKTHTVLETLLYLVFKTSSGNIHASIFRIAMAV